MYSFYVQALHFPGFPQRFQDIDIFVLSLDQTGQIDHHTGNFRQGLDKIDIFQGEIPVFGRVDAQSLITSPRT